MSLSSYLTSKRTVDDRALNRRVWNTFLDGLCEDRSAQDHLAILELAGGTGATARRVLKHVRGTDLKAIEYTLVDIEPAVIETAREKLPVWGRDLGFQVEVHSDTIECCAPDVAVQVELVCDDAFDVLDRVPAGTYDATITQMWLDLVNVQAVLERVFRVLADGGLFYAPLHVDGGTRFLPSIDPSLDRRIVDEYHECMDDRTTPRGPAGGHRTGSELLIDVPRCGGRIIASGASDWIVRPSSEGAYPHDEADFLHSILDFVESEVRGCRTIAEHRIDEWLSRRRSQVRNGTLIYVAHQLDVLAQNRWDS